jgi:hypothetical protein
MLVVMPEGAKAAMAADHRERHPSPMARVSSAAGRPLAGEAARYYFKYIDLVRSDDVVSVLERQLGETLAFLSAISEEKSRHRYAPDKWSLREALGHVNDVERLTLFRAFWFAREFESPLPSFDQGTCVAAADSDAVPWARHVEEFGALRRASLAFFGSMPAEAWTRTGVASDCPFSVRALAFLLAGHVSHHMAGIQSNYL